LQNLVREVVDESGNRGECKYVVLLWMRITMRIETVVRTGQQRTKKTFLLILYICRDEDVASMMARAWFKMVVPAGMVVRMRVYARTRCSKDGRVYHG
jgi:hypothetical protein